MSVTNSECYPSSRCSATSIYCLDLTGQKPDAWILAGISTLIHIGLFFTRIPIFYYYTQKRIVKSSNQAFDDAQLSLTKAPPPFKIQKSGDVLQDIDTLRRHELITKATQDSAGLPLDNLTSRMLNHGLGGWNLNQYMVISALIVLCHLVAKWFIFYQITHVERFNSHLQNCSSFAKWLTENVLVVHSIIGSSLFFSLHQLYMLQQLKIIQYYFTFSLNIASYIFAIDVVSIIVIFCYNYGLLLYTLLFFALVILICGGYLIGCAITWKIIVQCITTFVNRIPQLLSGSKNSYYGLLIAQLSSSIPILMFQFFTVGIVYSIIIVFLLQEKHTTIFYFSGDAISIAFVCIGIGCFVGIVAYFFGLMRQVTNSNLENEIREKHIDYLDVYPKMFDKYFQTMVIDNYNTENDKLQKILNKNNNTNKNNNVNNNAKDSNNNTNVELALQINNNNQSETDTTTKLPSYSSINYKSRLQKNSNVKNDTEPDPTIKEILDSIQKKQDKKFFSEGDRCELRKFKGKYFWSLENKHVLIEVEESTKRLFLFAEGWEENPRVATYDDLKHNVILKEHFGKVDKDNGNIHFDQHYLIALDTGYKPKSEATEKNCHFFERLYQSKDATDNMTENEENNDIWLKRLCYTFPFSLPYIDKETYLLKYKRTLLVHRQELRATDHEILHGNIINCIDYPELQFDVLNESKNHEMKEEDEKINIDELPKTRPIRILSLDGGGLRGVLSCEILREFEKYTRQSNCELFEAFDLIVGTSTGGLVSIGVGKYHMNVDGVREIYDEVAKKVFYRDSDAFARHTAFGELMTIMNTTSTLATSFYKHLTNQVSLLSTPDLEKIFQEKLGKDRRLFITEEERKNTSHCAVVSVRSDVAPNQPFVFRSYNNIIGCDDIILEDCRKLPMEPYAGTCFPLAWHAARATTAAVPYFETMKIPLHCLSDIAVETQSIDEDKDDKDDNDDNDAQEFMSFIDGGFVHNDPSLVALLEGKHLYGNERPVVLVSIGTGTLPSTKQQVPHSITKLSTSLFGGLFDAKEASSRVILRNILEEGKSYFRFNCTIKIDDMTETQCMAHWQTKGKSYANRPTVNDKISKIAKYCASFKNIPLPIKKY